jgi:hypothetical protein
VSQILVPDPPETPANARVRRLSRRRVKKLVRINQHWSDETGGRWRVMNVHRSDGQVELVAGLDGYRMRLFVTFGELGRHYQLEAGQ